MAQRRFTSREAQPRSGLDGLYDEAALPARRAGLSGKTLKVISNEHDWLSVDTGPKGDLSHCRTKKFKNASGQAKLTGLDNGHAFDLLFIIDLDMPKLR